MRTVHKNRESLERFCYKQNLRRSKKHRHFFEVVSDLGVLGELALKMTFLQEKGLRNAENLALNEVDLILPGLPEKFDGCRILFLTDLHVEKLEHIVDNIISITSEIDYDYCILGGDYTVWKSFDIKTSEGKMCRIVDSLKKRGRIFGVLGNHDKYETAEMLDSFGVEMLLNENVCLEKDSEKIYMVGIDDTFLYDADDLALGQEGIEADAFKILISHSPQLYKEAAKARCQLYLAGHTHGGQICLPGQIAVVSAAPIPRKMIKGLWEYDNMVGYTSCGCGVSGMKARFFCPPEIVLLKLRRGI